MKRINKNKKYHDSKYRRKLMKLILAYGKSFRLRNSNDDYIITDVYSVKSNNRDYNFVLFYYIIGLTENYFSRNLETHREVLKKFWRQFLKENIGESVIMIMCVEKNKKDELVEYWKYDKRFEILEYESSKTP